MDQVEKHPTKRKFCEKNGDHPKENTKIQGSHRSNGYSYIWRKDNTLNAEYYCSRHTGEKKCLGTGTAPLADRENIVVKRAHNHPENDLNEIEKKFHDELQRRAYSGVGTLQFHISAMRKMDGTGFASVLLENPSESYRRVFDIWKAKALKIPKIDPKFKGLEELYNIMLKDRNIMNYAMSTVEGEKHYKIEVELLKNEKGNCLLFYDIEWGRSLCRYADDAFVDSTFSRVARSCGYQFQTFMVEKLRKAFPVFFVLMESKDQVLYEQILKRVRDIFPHLRPVRVMADNERGMQNALENVFNNITVLICFFHQCKSLFEKALKTGVAIHHNRRDNPSKHLMLRRFMALSLMPPNLIEPCFQNLRDECFEQFGNDERNFEEFITYYQSYWLNKVTPAYFSVYDQQNRTNNYTESWHAQLGRLLDKHPLIQHVIGKLKSKQVYNTCDFNL